jgi:dipeptidase E
VRPPTILAMGGGGFTMEPDNPALDDFILALAQKREPRVLFLPTASGDPAAQIAAFHERFGGRACHAQHLSLFRLHGTTRPVSDILLDQDVIYVSGGSMRNLLAIWVAHGLDDVFREAWRRGIVLAGLSAGAMCWFEGGVTKSTGPPEPIEGLGLLPGSLTVHADGEPERLPVWLDAVRAHELPGGWAADDGVGLLFRERRLERVVSSRPAATALRVDAVEGELLRTRIQPALLGVAPGRPSPVDEDVRELRRVARMREAGGGRHGASPWR